MNEARAKTGDWISALPMWNLDDLYPGPQSRELLDAIEGSQCRIKDFEEAYKGKVAGLNGAAFGVSLRTYESISETLGRVASYAQLYHSEDVVDPDRGQVYQNLIDQITQMSSRLIFFSLEINQLNDGDVDVLLADRVVASYRPWIRDLRVFRDYQLSDELERLLHEKSVVGRTAWVRLFDETEAALRCNINGKTLRLTEALSLFLDPKAEIRKRAGKAVSEALLDKLPLFAKITNTLAKDKQIEDDWRTYPQPVSARNLANLVEDDVVEALVTAVKSTYAETAHRYYALKARWLGKVKLDYWDRNAPLPEAVPEEIAWTEAKSIVLDAYQTFSPQMAQIGRRFFDECWIDAGSRSGKVSGAFSHPTVPSAHPFILLNYMGNPRDVSTLAHELGHGVHQVLAADRGHLLAETPLILAETASVFGEMLTFQALLKAQHDPRRRRILLAEKVEDMLNTVVRQIAFYEFERIVHDERKRGELTADRLCQIWLCVQKESLGPAFEFSDEYRLYWSYIPHFLHTPFYVYAYAFGDCLVSALYEVYENSLVDNFQDRYLDMLRAGGTLRHKELLAPFGLKANDSDFWKKGMNRIIKLIDQLEETTL